MWECVKCREKLEGSFDACWNCGTTKDGVVDPHFQKPDVPPLGPGSDAAKDPITCPRCSRALEYVGAKSFHEGKSWGVFGELGELFVNKERFDVYCCPRCGRVEFFVDGIGEQFRPR